MRSVFIVMAALLGLAASAGTASAQSFAPRCPQACGSCNHWSKYSGNCNYPACQRPIPPDPWANRRGCNGNGNGQGGEGFQWHPYLRSPRDFWMLPIP
jgi:hypothetical protein